MSLWILSVILITLTFLSIIFVAAFTTSKIDEEKFSFLRVFPFETRKKSVRNGKPYLWLIYTFSILCFLPLIYIATTKTSLVSLNSLSILIGVLLGLDAIIFVFVNIYDVTHVKAHLNLFICFAFVSLLCSALIFARSCVAYKTFMKYNRESPLLFVSEICSGIMTISVMIICLNPKLKTWAKLDTLEGENVIYKRPKKFVLAYSEWALFLSIFINEILYFVQLLAK